MILYVSQTLPSGKQIIGDGDNPAFYAILEPGQFAAVKGLPEDEQCQRIDEYVKARRAASKENTP